MKKTHQDFYDEVMVFYKLHGRNELPWRKNVSPYSIVVSEIMLQQTQVDRVIPFFIQWMKLFPSWKKLAQAPQSNVLRAWKGLGYNSRALRLQKLAQTITQDFSSRVPKDKKTLESLPGIGPYTSSAILAFAFNIYTPTIETNIRRVFIHHFFKKNKKVSDKDILSILSSLNIPDARSWYWALMDYGSILKKTLSKNPNQKSKHYTKQKKFSGSDREIRGKILALLLEKECISLKTIEHELAEKNIRIQKILKDLEKEGFLESKNSVISLK